MFTRLCAPVPRSCLESDNGTEAQLHHTTAHESLMYRRYREKAGMSEQQLFSDLAWHEREYLQRKGLQDAFEQGTAEESGLYRVLCEIGKESVSCRPPSNPSGGTHSFSIAGGSSDPQIRREDRSRPAIRR